MNSQDSNEAQQQKGKAEEYQGKKGRKCAVRRILMYSAIGLCGLAAAVALWQFVAFRCVINSADIGFADFMKIRSDLILRQGVRTSIERIRTDRGFIVMDMKWSKRLSGEGLKPEVATVVYSRVGRRYEWVGTQQMNVYK